MKRNILAALESRGPWAAHGCTVYTSDDWQHGTNHGGKFVASTYYGDSDDMPTEEQAANARLIAAAPELLEFAEKVERSACLDQRVGDKCICSACEARRLIAKALGS